MLARGVGPGVGGGGQQQILKCVYEEANKETIRPIDAASFTCPHTRRPLKLDVRDRRHLVRYTPKKQS